MITRSGLVDRLAGRALSGWSVVERIQDIALADERRRLQRRDHRTRLTLIVHQDLPLGRGSARLDLDAYDGSPDELIDQALALALAAVGPAWTAPPPAAPAKVSVVDTALVERAIDAVATSILAELQRPAGVTIAAAASVLRETVTVTASSGFHATWPATAVQVDAIVTAAADDRAADDRAAGACSLRVVRHARRLDDLGLDAAIAAAAADLLHLARAAPPSPGPCALWLGPEALLHGDDRGLWAIFAQQSDSAAIRQGIGRYRWRAEIAPGASQLPEPLTITSTGSLDFATRSTPVTDDAVAVRNFALIERGLAVGLGLSPREAALRGMDPNGGVRNLIVAGGSWSPPPPTSPAPSTAPASPSPARTVELRRLNAVSIDLHTGAASLDIALGFEHHPDRVEPTPFTGGTVRLDLISALGRARRSNQLIQRAAYHGPDSIFIDDAQLIV